MFACRETGNLPEHFRLTSYGNNFFEKYERKYSLMERAQHKFCNHLYSSFSLLSA